MEVAYERCCGLDIHKQTVVACVIVPGDGKQPRKEIRSFKTMTADLLDLADWLTALITEFHSFSQPDHCACSETSMPSLLACCCR